MRARIVGLVVGLGAIAGTAIGQTPAPNPVLLYANDLKARKGGEREWPAAAKVGVEVYRHDPSGAAIFLSQSGDLAVCPAFPAEKDAARKTTWAYANDLSVRKAAEERFTKETAKVGVEVFKDGASGKLLLVTDKGAIAVADAPDKLRADADPVWHHALTLKVRGPNEATYKDAAKFGVEAYTDGNTGGLVYVTERGFVAVAPAPPKAPDAVKRPVGLYGMDLQVRKADEKEFTGQTKKVVVEVFRDENTGGLVYLSETGAIATAPAPADAKTGLGVRWMYAMMLKARPGGEAELGKANKYGVEVFQDNNTGHLVFVSDAGGIAVLPKK